MSLYDFVLLLFQMTFHHENESKKNNKKIGYLAERTENNLAMLQKLYLDE